MWKKGGLLLKDSEKTENIYWKWNFQSLSARQYFESIETEAEKGIDLNAMIFPVYPYIFIC